MIPFDVTILAKGSCPKDIRNSRSFKLLYLRGDWSSHEKYYMFYIHCDGKLLAKNTKKGI